MPTCQCVFERQAQERALRDREEQRAKIEGLFALASLGPRFSDCTFDNWEPKPGTEPMHAAAVKYAAEFPANGRGLLFYGQPGNGKTHLAAAVVNGVIPLGMSCVFRSTPALLKQIERANRPGSKEDEAALYQAMHDADLVVLDDLGAEKWTEHREMALYLIVDDRYRWRKPVICTTNCTLDELEEKVGERTFDRLLEMCAGGVIQNSGKSYRKEQAAKRIASIKKGGEVA